jgi:hypothetical protein
MAYIGKAPVNGFHSKQSLTTDGSTTTFTLDYTVADETSLIVSVGGVLQEPKIAYNLAGGGTQITFTAAPASTDTAYIQFLGQAIVQNLFDVNGTEFVLDVDADTSFTADTDDEIDIKVGGTDRSTIKATGFHNVDSVKFVAGTGDDMQMYHDGTNSYLTNSTGALKIATETSGIALTIGHTTSEVTIGDNLTVTGNLTIGGTTSFGDFDITNVGSLALDTITNDGTDITLDSSGDIILDAGGNTVFLKDSGTTFGSLDNSSGELVIKSGSTPTTALTFAGANATFAGTLGVGAVTSTGIVTGTGFTAGSAVLAEAELELLDGLTAGTAIATKVVTTDANIDTTGQRNLTITGELDAATGDFSGDVDIDGTLEADAITINGTAIASVLSPVAGHASIVTVGALNAGSITSGFTSIDVGAGAITTTGVITGGTVEATTDTAAGDNAAMGYTAGEGLILTGQGSTSDVVIKNDADATVFSVATGTTTGTFAGTVLAKTDTDTSNTGSVTLDFTANQNFVLTLTGNVTLANPSTEQVGQSGFIAFIQDGTGSRTITLGTDYETAAGAGLTLTSTASATDLVPYLVVAANRILLGTPQLAFA